MIGIMFFLIISTIYSLWYIVNSLNNDLWSMLYSISLSYIVAVIFYFLQVVIPKIKRLKAVNIVLKTRIKNLINCVNKLYIELNKLYNQISDNSCETINNFAQIQSKFNLNDNTSIVNTRKIKNIEDLNSKNNKLTVRELLINTINTLNDKIDFLYITFPEYLSNEMIEIFENIKESEFMSCMSLGVIMQPNMNFSISVDDHNIFEEFWELNKRLVKIYERIKIK